MRRASRQPVQALAIGSVRLFQTRGMPYTPQGTMQDFTGSPRYQGLESLKRQMDLAAGRKPGETNLFGSTVPGMGSAEDIDTEGLSEDHKRMVAAMQRNPNRSRQRQQQQDQERSMPPDFEESTMSEQRRIAMRRFEISSWDNYGPNPRVWAPPAPPVDPKTAPQGLKPPRAMVFDDLWYAMITAIVIAICLAIRYSK